MAFLETPRFPESISVGAVGGANYKTDIVMISSGFEQRNISWDVARASYDVSHSVKEQNDLYTIIKFFRSVKGMAHGFRFKDWSDYECLYSEGLLGTGVGTGEQDYQLVKKYDAGALYELRDITKPVIDTINIYKNDLLLTENVDYVLDYTTGIVSFYRETDTLEYPTAEDVLTWEGQFDVPCRFNTDKIEVELITKNLQGWNSIPIIEIRV